MNHNRKVVAVDLDGTLLHLQPEQIEVPGATVSSFLSAAALERLQELSRLSDLVIATARNSYSVTKLVSQLPDVKIAGFVMENGLVARPHLERHPDHFPPWEDIAQHLSHWRRLIGYEACLGLVPPKTEPNAFEILSELVASSSEPGIIYRDRHKLFVYPYVPNKHQGLEKLGFSPWMALGNDTNDLELMQASSRLGTLVDATGDIQSIVHSKNGFCSRQPGHDGTVELLEWALSVVSSQ
ncbi:MAG: hypothetical protein HY774_08040 [Acidobacteria bacterium]|nr:hypothetical protein [Acidobacteriota bacterium]